MPNPGDNSFQCPHAKDGDDASKPCSACWQMGLAQGQDVANRQALASPYGLRMEFTPQRHRPGRPWGDKPATTLCGKIYTDLVANYRVMVQGPIDCPECIIAEATKDPRASRISFLERKKIATKADLLMKFEDDDYHGVADAAMDLRYIVSELAGLRFGKGQ